MSGMLGFLFYYFTLKYNAGILKELSALGTKWEGKSLF